MIEFPAGKRDRGEDLLHCARRELREETGHRAREWRHAGVLHPLIAYSDEFIDIWFARGSRPAGRDLDPGETLDVFTARPDELMAWCRSGAVTDGKTLSATLWLQNVLSGQWTLDWVADPSDAAGTDRALRDNSGHEGPRPAMRQRPCLRRLVRLRG